MECHKNSIKLIYFDSPGLSFSKTYSKVNNNKKDIWRPPSLSELTPY